MRTDRPSFDRAIDGEASDWVLRERTGLDAIEKRKLAAWLSARPEHREAYDRLLAMAAVFPRVRAQGAGTALLSELEARRRRRQMRRRTSGIAAASFVAVAAIFWLRAMVDSQVPQSAYRAATFEPFHRLPDGSAVELKQGAEITVQFEAAFRRVALVRGEAIFRVTHDPSRPFIVSASGVEVRAVGTAFNVRLDPGAVEVLVTEGKVRLDDALGGNTLLPRTPIDNILPAAAEIEPVLAAGQEAVVEIDRPGNTKAAKVVQLRPEEIKRNLSWRAPRLNFDGIELAQAVHKINEMNNLKIILSDRALGELRLSGTFAPDDPETFSRLAAASFGLRVKRRSEEVIVLFRD